MMSRILSSVLICLTLSGVLANVRFGSGRFEQRSSHSIEHGIKGEKQEERSFVDYLTPLVDYWSHRNYSSFLLEAAFELCNQLEKEALDDQVDIFIQLSKMKDALDHGGIAGIKALRERPYLRKHTVNLVNELVNIGQVNDESDCSLDTIQYTLQLLNNYLNLDKNIESLAKGTSQVLLVERENPKYIDKLYNYIRGSLTERLSSCTEFIGENFQVYVSSPSYSYVHEIDDMIEKKLVNGNKIEENTLTGAARSLEGSSLIKDEGSLRKTLEEACNSIVDNSSASIGVYILAEAQVPSLVENNIQPNPLFEKILEYSRICHSSLMETKKPLKR